MYMYARTQFGKKFKKEIDTGTLNINKWSCSPMHKKKFGREKQFIETLIHESPITDSVPI